MLEVHGDDAQDGFETYAKECVEAVGTLKSLQWERIRRERFSLTPEGLYAELVRNAESLLYRHAAEEQRRREWLNAEVAEVADDEAPVPIRASNADKYGIDLELFKMKTGRKPPEWKKACLLYTSPSPRDKRQSRMPSSA